MVGPFSTLEDFKLHWAALPADKDLEATQKIKEASIKIRGQFPDIDTRLADGRIALETVQLVVHEMVKRALDSPAGDELAGVQQATGQTGPFTTTLQYTNPDGNLYLSRDDRRMLSAGRPGKTKQAFSIFPGGIGARTT